MLLMAIQSGRDGVGDTRKCVLSVLILLRRFIQKSLSRYLAPKLLSSLNNSCKGKGFTSNLSLLTSMTAMIASLPIFSCQTISYSMPSLLNRDTPVSLPLLPSVTIRSSNAMSEKLEKLAWVYGVKRRNEGSNLHISIDKQ